MAATSELIEIDNKLRAFTKSKPSDAEHQSTIGFCETGIELGISKFKAVLSRQHPVEAIERALQIPNQVPLPKPDIYAEQGQLIMNTDSPNRQGSIILREGIFWALYMADQALGIAKYVEPIFPDYITSNVRSREARFHARVSNPYTGFMQRFRAIQEQGEFDNNSPVSQAAAIGFFGQIAKNSAVEKVRTFTTKRASLFTGIGADTDVNSYLNRAVVNAVTDIRADESYIARSLATERKIAEDAELTDENVELIHDLMFIQRGKLGETQFSKEVLQPILDSIKTGDWDRAMELRDFILINLSNAFPEFRVREFKRENPNAQVLTKTTLYAGVRAGLVNLDELNVPEEYSNGSKLGRRLETISSIAERDILRNTVGHTTWLIEAVAEKTARKVFEDWLFYNYPAIRFDRRLIDTFYESKVNFKYLLMDNTYTETDAIQIRTEMERRLEAESPKYGKRSHRAKRLRIPHLVDISTVRFDPKKGQEYGFVTDQEKGTISSGSVGHLLYKLIETSLGARLADRPTLSQSELNDIFREIKEAHPEAFRRYSFDTYLRAVILKLSPDLPTDDPVLKFIDNLGF